MSLLARQLAAKLKENEFAAFKTQLKQITGHDIEINLDWASFTSFDEFPITRMNDYLFKPILEAFSRLCVDQIGLDAVRDGVASISLFCTDNSNSPAITFRNKVLTMKSHLAGDAFSYQEGDVIYSVLNDKL